MYAHTTTTHTTTIQLGPQNTVSLCYASILYFAVFSVSPALSHTIMTFRRTFLGVVIFIFDVQYYDIDGIGQLLILWPVLPQP